MTTASRPLRALIIDDEPLAREGIRLFLAGDVEIDVVGEAVDGRDAIAAINRARPDLIFLDVQMPEYSGFEVLRNIDATRFPLVIFVTAFDQYAIAAFEAHALDYLLKPVEANRFAQTLARAKERFREREFSEVTSHILALIQSYPTGEKPAPGYIERFSVPLAGRIQLVATATVDWIEAEDDYVRLHVGKSAHLIRKSLSALDSELDPALFARIHRSTTVNLSRIKELHPLGQGEYAVVLMDGTRLKMSRTYRDRLSHLLP